MALTSDNVCALSKHNLKIYGGETYYLQLQYSVLCGLEIYEM